MERNKKNDLQTQYAGVAAHRKPFFKTIQELSQKLDRPKSLNFKSD